MNMTEIENRTRAYLRRLDTKLDSVMRDITELKQDRAMFNQQRLTPGLSCMLDIISEQVAALGQRFDQMDQRLERIERRVGLVDANPAVRATVQFEDLIGTKAAGGGTPPEGPVNAGPGALQGVKPAGPLDERSQEAP